MSFHATFTRTTESVMNQKSNAVEIGLKLMGLGAWEQDELIAVDGSEGM